MSFELFTLLIIGILLIACLYSSVGHAGASGYIAIMSLLSMAPEVIKPTALALNILVASIATFQFTKAGHFSWALFWPFAIFSIPLAFIGGHVSLPTHVFKIVLGIILLYAAFLFFVTAKQVKQIKSPPKIQTFASGAGIGLLSGLTGTGGGIFLTPLLLIMGWADAKRAAAVSALFVLVNSVSGLLGNYAALKSLPSFIVPLLLAAGLGGVVGAYFGSQRIPSDGIKRLLAVVLLIAGFKLILT